MLLLTLREITRRVRVGSGVALRCVLSHVCSSFRTIDCPPDPLAFEGEQTGCVAAGTTHEDGS